MIQKKQIALRAEYLSMSIFEKLMDGVGEGGRTTVNPMKARGLSAAEKRAVCDLVERRILESCELMRDRVMLAILDNEEYFKGRMGITLVDNAYHNFIIQIEGREGFYRIVDSAVGRNYLDVFKIRIRSYLRSKYGGQLRPCFRVDSDEDVFFIPNFFGSNPISPNDYQHYILFLVDLLIECDSKFRFNMVIQTERDSEGTVSLPRFMCGYLYEDQTSFIGDTEVGIMRSAVVSPLYLNVQGITNNRRMIIVEDVLMGMNFTTAVCSCEEIRTGVPVMGSVPYARLLFREVMDDYGSADVRRILRAIVDIKKRYIPYHEAGHLVVDGLSGMPESNVFAYYMRHFEDFSEIMANFAPVHNECAGLFTSVYKLSRRGRDHRRFTRAVLYMLLLEASFSTFRETLRGRLELGVIDAIFPQVDAIGRREIHDENFEILIGSSLFSELLDIHTSCRDYIVQHRPQVVDFEKFMGEKWPQIEAVFKRLMAQMRPIPRIRQELVRPELALQAVIRGDKSGRGDDGVETYRRPPGPKIGRNEPCPCGSGKKYKKCCGK